MFQAGSLAGNLAMKHQNLYFQSDLFVALEALGSMLYITGSDSEDGLEEMAIIDYLDCEMNKKIILNVILPTLDNSSHHFRVYKVSCPHPNRPQAPEIPS